LLKRKVKRHHGVRKRFGEKKRVLNGKGKRDRHSSPRIRTEILGPLKKEKCKPGSREKGEKITDERIPVKERGTKEREGGRLRPGRGGGGGLCSKKKKTLLAQRKKGQGARRGRCKRG